MKSLRVRPTTSLKAGLVVLAVSIVPVAGCAPSSNDLWARHALVQKMNEGAMIVDVRTPKEFEGGRVKGAVNIPHLEIPQRIAEFGEDHARPIVVYCGIGGRAQRAKMMLEERGFTNVWNLGGYSNLAEAGPEVTESHR
jgi:phage shock protein E